MKRAFNSPSCARHVDADLLYLSRGDNLSEKRPTTLEAAKGELRKAFGKSEEGS